MAQCTQLEGISLSHNQLGGAVNQYREQWFGKLTKLSVVELAFNEQMHGSGNEFTQEQFEERFPERDLKRLRRAVTDGEAFLEKAWHRPGSALRTTRKVKADIDASVTVSYCPLLSVTVRYCPLLTAAGEGRHRRAALVDRHQGQGVGHTLPGLLLSVTLRSVTVCDCLWLSVAVCDCP